MADLPGGVNPLDFLYKLSLQRGLPPPVFSQYTEDGPPHLRRFVWTCSFNSLEAHGAGRSKKEAKVAAATELKRNLDFSSLPPIVEKKKRPNNKSESQLAHNARKKIKKDVARQPQGNTNPFGMAPTLTFESFRGCFLYDEKFADDSIDLLPSPLFPVNVFSSRISKMDRFVFLKTYEIRPTDSELSNTRNLTETTESVLTDVINHMNSGDEKIFEGRFRIGDLQKVTMLKGIRKLELLLMCFSRPTQTLLRNLVENVKAKMEEKDVEKKFKVELIDDFSGLCTSLKDGEDTFVCNVLITSRSLRHKPSEKTTLQEIPSSDEISTEICFRALAEHRHARWVHVTSRSTPGYLDTIRIMKEIQLRDPTWAKLSPWAMEVLVERALNTASLPPNPAACVMRVMEVISCGFLYKTSSGLRDPCEYGLVDVLDGMEEKDRDCLTAKAQMQLRMMHFRKTDIVLDLHSVGDPDMGWHHGGGKRQQNHPRLETNLTEDGNEKLIRNDQLEPESQKKVDIDQTEQDKQNGN